MLTWNDVIALAQGGNLEPDMRVVKSEDEWRRQLSAEQFRVTRQAGTERAFSSEMCSIFEPGIYACQCCGTVLFDASHKFESGTGWPSFTQPVKPNVIAYHLDRSHGMERVETTVFGGTPRSQAELAADLPRIADETDDPRWVAYRDGEALGAAGMAVVDGVARLWGAAVLPAAQHTGVYRALLEQRLCVGAERGCRMALVKGRVQTSAPTLLRAGFEQYGEERVYRVSR